MKTAMQEYIEYLEGIKERDKIPSHVVTTDKNYLETEKQQTIDLCTEAYEMGLVHKDYNPADIFTTNKETLK